MCGKKGRIQDLYIEVDSILPERPEFEFLRDRKFRVRTIKLRKQISQGLVLAVTMLPQGDALPIGTDVTEILGIKKYDPEGEQERMLLSEANNLNTEGHKKLFRFMMRYRWFRKYSESKVRKREFPAWIAKTDEERIQNKAVMFQSEKRNGTEFIVTEKIDGQSATYFLKKIGAKKYEFGVCSRNIHLCKPNHSTYWTIATKYNIKAALMQLIGDYDHIILQGEIIGPEIHKNKYQVNDYDFYAFNLIVPNLKYDTIEISQKLNQFGIKTVPIVDDHKQLPETIAELVEYSKGDSVLLKNQNREGVVMRNIGRDISFKVINPEFSLANED